jgi:outer membrane protein assembly factor BamD (BamD/ComL family)
MLGYGEVNEVVPSKDKEPSKAEQIYNQALSLQADENAYEAVQVLSELIVHHATNDAFIAKAELLSAQLYTDLALWNAAESTAKQVMNLYVGTETAAEASSLLKTIEKLRLEAENSEAEE